MAVDEKGHPRLAEMSAAGVSYEPVGKVEGLADDAMEHGGMRDLATVSLDMQWGALDNTPVHMCARRIDRR